MLIKRIVLTVLMLLKEIVLKVRIVLRGMVPTEWY